MYRFILLPIILLWGNVAFAQSGFQITVKDAITKQALPGVTVTVNGQSARALSDTVGNVDLQNIPAGDQTIILTHSGYTPQEFIIHFPAGLSERLNIMLFRDDEEMEEVIISSTRTSRTIANTPTRVEIIDIEEIDEKSNMRPANISMLLHESTGMQVQQTSATSANASIRLQGLDGKYTQLLKDGYPSFGNFAGGLSILEIPPLDLKQVEIIKGPASTLYGAGAIAGVVNLISKTPKEKVENSFIINQSNVGQTNIGAYASKKFKKTGYTLLALGNIQRLYDVDKDGFTELPKSKDFTLHPKLFFYLNEHIVILLGNSLTAGDRRGGDVQVLKGNASGDHVYFENNATLRNTATLDITKMQAGGNRLNLKTAFSFFDREITAPGYRFRGVNNNLFTDISFAKNFRRQTLIGGGNFIHDRFRESLGSAPLLRDFATLTGGIYTQHTADITDKLKLESGLRADLVHYSNKYYSKTEAFILPRISALFIFSGKWSSRIGGGLGYKTPTSFTEETETILYRDLLPLNHVKSEQSAGATADINFHSSIGPQVSFSLNQLFFYTNIRYSSVLQQDNSGDYFFSNTGKEIKSSGFETNAKLIYREYFKLFAGYTFIHAKAGYLPGKQFLPLQPASKLNLALIFEKENNFKTGLEAYFTGRQYLSNGTRTPAFSELGFMAEKIFSHFSVFINAENFTDTRQSRYKPVVSGTTAAPVFDEIWTHTEGRTFNGGIKIKL